MSSKVLNGRCSICGEKCDERFKVCYFCNKNSADKNESKKDGICTSCGKQCNGKYKLCWDCKQKANESMKTCTICGKKYNGDFDKCYDCNFPSKCKICGKKCKEGFEKCFECNSRETTHTSRDSISNKGKDKSTY